MTTQTLLSSDRKERHRFPPPAWRAQPRGTYARAARCLGIGNAQKVDHRCPEFGIVQEQRPPKLLPRWSHRNSVHTPGRITRASSQAAQVRRILPSPIAVATSVTRSARRRVLIAGLSGCGTDFLLRI